MDHVYKQTRFGPPDLCRIVYFLAGGMVFASLMQIRRNISQGILNSIIMFIIMGGVSLLNWAISRGYQRRQQRRRDDRSARILADVQNGSCGEYSLYLRSFQITGKMQEHSSLDRGSVQFESRFGEIQMDLETIIATAAEEVAPMVALGAPMEHFGAGRIQSSEADWQHRVEILANSAKLIFVIPADTLGTAWEIEWIVNNRHTGKCLFIMPRKYPNLSWSQRWQAITDRVAPLGIQLPAYRPEGLLFTLNESGQVAFTRAMRLTEAKQIRKDIEQITNSLTTGEPLVEPLPFWVAHRTISIVRLLIVGVVIVGAVVVSIIMNIKGHQEDNLERCRTDELQLSLYASDLDVYRIYAKFVLGDSASDAEIARFLSDLGDRRPVVLGQSPARSLPESRAAFFSACERWVSNERCANEAASIEAGFVPEQTWCGKNGK